jgi:hypothetical protein
MLACTLALFAIFGLAHVAAVSKRRAEVTLSPAQVEAFKPYSRHAAAAYCSPSQTLSWSCGGWSFGRPILSK